MGCTGSGAKVHEVIVLQTVPLQGQEFVPEPGLMDVLAANRLHHFSDAAAMSGGSTAL